MNDLVFIDAPPSVIIMFFYPFLISFSWTFTESLVRLLFFCFSSHKPQKIKEKKITCWSCLVLFVSASMFSFSSSSFYVLKLRPLHYILNLIYSCLVVLDIVFSLLSPHRTNRSSKSNQSSYVFIIFEIHLQLHLKSYRLLNDWLSILDNWWVSLLSCFESEGR